MSKLLKVWNKSVLSINNQCKIILKIEFPANIVVFWLSNMQYFWIKLNIYGHGKRMRLQIKNKGFQKIVNVGTLSSCLTAIYYAYAQSINGRQLLSL